MVISAGVDVVTCVHQDSRPQRKQILTFEYRIQIYNYQTLDVAIHTIECWAFYFPGLALCKGGILGALRAASTLSGFSGICVGN